MIQHIRESCGLSSIKGNLIILFKDNIACIAQIIGGYIKGDRTKHISPKFFCTHELQKSGEKPKSSQHWKGHQPANPDHERKGRFSTRQRACIPHQGGKLFCAFFSLPFAYEIFLK